MLGRAGSSFAAKLSEEGKTARAPQLGRSCRGFEQASDLSGICAVLCPLCIVNNYNNNSFLTQLALVFTLAYFRNNGLQIGVSVVRVWRWAGMGDGKGSGLHLGL